MQPSTFQSHHFISTIAIHPRNSTRKQPPDPTAAAVAHLHLARLAQVQRYRACRKRIEEVKEKRTEVELYKSPPCKGCMRFREPVILNIRGEKSAILQPSALSISYLYLEPYLEPPQLSHAHSPLRAAAATACSLSLQRHFATTLATYRNKLSVVALAHHISRVAPETQSSTSPNKRRLAQPPFISISPCLDIRICLRSLFRH
ncbi:hypothetical protein FN846DRAFT_309828 [Sphaerosporella brunnea]|uniref:Uncharacterized protein n=1 Tax=Sphaerosporella brunnea TaxID=1250544 RepID=A0A5J5F6S3_9PEZI|nr:hypothetical protein FN846DRAFT_309828 [Sphaerosporella brunnea]